MLRAPVSVFTRRLLVLCLACAIASCSPSAPRSISVAGLEGEGAESSSEEELDQRSLVSSEMALPERVVLSEKESLGLGLEMIEEGDRVELVMRGTGEQIEFEVSRDSIPNQIVLDLVGQSVSEAKSISVDDSELVSSIEMEPQGDRVQIVVGLKEGAELDYEAEPIASNLYLTISKPDSMMMAGKQDVADTAAPLAESAAIDTASAGMQAEPKLEALKISDLPGKGNAVVAQMSSAGIFTLTQTAPSEYVLRLEGAKHDPLMVRTLLAPPNSGDIRSARVVQEGDDTLVRIFAKPTTKLQATTQANAITVQPSEYMSPGDIRAQAEVTIEEDSGEEIDLNGDAALEELESEVGSLLDDAPKYSGRKISLDLQDTDIDNALRIIAEVSNLNIIASDDVAGKVTLRLIDVPWDQALDVILKTNGLDRVLEGNVMRIAPIEKLRQERESLKQAREAEEELEPLVVKYVRVSYAKAAELRPLVETVLTERGTVTYDERTNQLIIKDIRRGVRNVAELVSRLDLRTPQVLLETQIVEAQRSFLRDLGSELGFNFIQSPETGNPTGKNFPNSVEFGGSVADGGVASSFPAAIDETAGSAVSLLLDSADGTKSLDYRLSALERDGNVRIVSRPAVATTNNQQAVIKSVEKIRVKTPSGGLSVATGAGASAAGSGGVATETIEIGIVLEVTPQASPDYFVLLDINAKSSTLGSTFVDGIPSEVERSATSTVLVSSGQTFAMGGIYKITDRDNVSGVPFLKDIPFLGHMFRQTNVDNADEELIFFITPRIVEGSFDDAAMKLSS